MKAIIMRNKDSKKIRCIWFLFDEQLPGSLQVITAKIQCTSLYAKVLLSFWPEKGVDDTMTLTFVFKGDVLVKINRIDIAHTSIIVDKPISIQYKRITQDEIDRVISKIGTVI